MLFIPFWRLRRNFYHYRLSSRNTSCAITMPYIDFRTKDQIATIDRPGSIWTHGKKREFEHKIDLHDWVQLFHRNTLFAIAVRWLAIRRQKSLLQLTSHGRLTNNLRRPSAAPSALVCARFTPSTAPIRHIANASFLSNLKQKKKQKKNVKKRKNRYPANWVQRVNSYCKICYSIRKCVSRSDHANCTALPRPGVKTTRMCLFE